MARYELREVGVFDNEAGELCLPTDTVKWNQYLNWLAMGMNAEGVRGTMVGRGNAPDPDSTIKSPPRLELVARAKAAVRSVYQSRDALIFNTPLGTFSINDDVRTWLGYAMALAAGGVALPANFGLYDINGNFVTLTTAQLRQLALGLVTRGLALAQRRAELHANIDAAQDPTTVDPAANWPNV